MITIQLEDARSDLTQVLERIASTRERVVVLQGERRIAALVPVEDAELLEAMEEDVLQAAGDPWRPEEEAPEEKRLH